MSKLYRLPDGTEVRPADSNLIKVQTLANHTWVIHPELGAISCYTGLLTEVKPPLPPVPDVPAVLIGDQVWARDDIKGVGPVFVLPGGPTLGWEELNAHAEAQGKPIVPLVEDPAVSAPPLPWTKPTTDGRYPDLVVDRSPLDGGVLELNGFGLAQNQIRELMGICARMLKPGAERDRLQAAALSVEGKDTNAQT